MWRRDGFREVRRENGGFEERGGTRPYRFWLFPRPVVCFIQRTVMSAGLTSQPLAPEFWTALEGVPGGTALPTIWRRHLNAYADFEPFSSLFLRSRPEAVADFVPCPWKCGCSHKVVPRDNGTLAISRKCRCSVGTVINRLK